MKKKLVFVLFLKIGILSAQINNCLTCDYGLSYPELNFELVPKLGSQKILIGGDTTLELNLFICKGASEISLYFKNTKIIKGQTINGLRLLVKQENKVDLVTLEKSVGVTEYYEPIYDGLWEYWDKKGKKIRDIIYRDGIIVSTKNY